MKTKTLLLVSFVLSLTLSTAYPKTVIPVTIEISLAKAIKNPELVQAMHLQLDGSFLQDAYTDGRYSVTVLFRYIEFTVTGTHIEWLSFFLMDPIYESIDKLESNSKP